MDERQSWLEIRFDGDAVGPGTVPLPLLLRFLTSLEQALQRVGRVMRGDTTSVRKGRPPQADGNMVNLDLASLKPGSPAAVLGFERRPTEPNLPGMDVGDQLLTTALQGLAVVQEQEATGALPMGYDAGVLTAWRHAGSVFEHGIDEVAFTFNPEHGAVRASFTPLGLGRIKQRITAPQVNVRTIEGRLLMVDFKERGMRCRVHPPIGEPILCDFGEDQKKDVLQNLMGFVRVQGEATQSITTGRISSITIQDIGPLDKPQDDLFDLQSRGASFSQSFWESPTLEQLAREQGVSPMTDPSTMFGTWPGESDDGFEEAVRELRRSDLSRDDLA